MGLQLIKLVGGLMMPLPLILVLMAAGLLLLASARRRRVGVFLMVIGFVLLLAVSAPGISGHALASLEGAYPLLKEPLPRAEWVVVLGGGVRWKDDRPPAARLGAASLYRIMEGVRLAHLMPEARLVASGRGTAPVTAAVAEEMGICGERIVVNDMPLNTYQEALEVAKIIGVGDTVILVTFASHMRRAVALFEGQGIDVVASPTGHVAEASLRSGYLVSYLPRAGNIVFAETVLRENMGLVWARLQGWT
jgi:uncharacterized SAM-binding protein YcdF (DUF218 family)